MNAQNEEIDDNEDTPTETIFDEVGGYVEDRGGETEGSRTGDEDYQSAVRKMIEDSENFEKDFLQMDREDLTKYYYGDLPAMPVKTDPQGPDTDDGADMGRSTIVSTDVRDTVMAIMPSLIRIFANDESAVYYASRTEKGEAEAEQATDYVNYVFWEDNDGFLTLHSVLKDALTVKTGIVKWWTETREELSTKAFRGIHEDQLNFMLSEAEQAGLDAQVASGYAVDQRTGLIDEVSVTFLKSTPMTRVEAVPPDEFRISRYARTLETAGLVGHYKDAYVSELVDMGFDPDLILDNISTRSNFSEERFLRNPGLVMDENVSDTVPYGEWFIRIDGDGDGIDELRKICTIGSDFTILSDEPVDTVDFALFCGDPRPHTVIGDAIADLVKDIQKIKTNMIRSTLDNLAESVNPKTVINELLVNVEDALNDEVGSVIRSRGNPNETVAFAKIPFVGKEIFEGLIYMDRIKESRTGITEASKGLDPKALQSTTMMGVDAIISGAQERIELIARIFAETGFKRLFKGLLREITNNPNQARTVKMRGKWVDVNPSLFDPNMTVKVNPRMGKGTDAARMQTLLGIQAAQKEIITTFGVDNPLCGPEEYRNTVEDILKLSNFNNVTRYFKVIPPGFMEQVKAQPKEPTPEMLLAKSEMEKVKAGVIKTIAETRNMETSLEQKAAKDKADEAFRRDKMIVDAVVKTAGVIGQTGYNPDLDPLLASLNVPDNINSDAVLPPFTPPQPESAPPQ